MCSRVHIFSPSKWAVDTVAGAEVTVPLDGVGARLSGNVTTTPATTTGAAAAAGGASGTAASPPLASLFVTSLSTLGPLLCPYHFISFRRYD